jgi:hypothetical protein
MSESEMDDDLVWISGAYHGGENVYHTNPDCGILNRADGTRQVALSHLVGQYRECQHHMCAGETPPFGDDRTCPYCGEQLPANGLPDHLPCDGGGGGV